jgi:hypothetical protein
MSTIIPIEKIPHDIWVNLCFDLGFIVNRYWPAPDPVFESLQGIEIAPPCMIRWLFVVQNPLRSDAAGQDLPQQVRFSGGIESTTVLVSDALPPTVPRIAVLPGRAPTAKVASPRWPGRAQRKAQGRSSEGQRSGGALEALLADRPIVEKGEMPLGEEAELTLIFIDTLGCYYCADNQRYYQIDAVTCE